MAKSVALFGKDMFGEAIRAPTAGPLADRFGIPPFSVLDARQGYWQERKRAWLNFGIKSELGRGSGGAPGGSPRPATRLNEDGRTDRGDGAGRSLARNSGQDLMRGEHSVGAGHTGASSRAMELAGESASEHGSGTSIFDPVLCELAYRWYCPPGGQVLDPFAGGSVRGVVAGMLGRHYHGIDLRAEQIAANEAQADQMSEHLIHRPMWTCGDSLKATMVAADLVFSCPPYADLERYSDSPDDLSTMDYDSFRAAYAAIIRRAVGALRPNRFAAFVVGDVRDEKGFYRNFPAHTIEAFEAAGARLYNEAILLTAIGSLPLRINRQFTAARKLGKTHQNVLVFVKGDPKKAADACGAIAIK